MEPQEAQRQVKAALWKKETGLDKIFSTSPKVTMEALEALGIPASKADNAIVVEGYENLYKMKQAGADFANKGHYNSGVRGVAE
jgi:hypothetical protein